MQTQMRQSCKILFGNPHNKFIRLLCEGLFESLHPAGIITNPWSLAWLAEDLKQVFIDTPPRDPDYSAE